MSWGEPRWLLLLWLLPLLLLLLLRDRRRRARLAQQFYGAEMRQRLAPADPPGRFWLRTGLALLGVGCLAAAAARPRFGVYFEDVPVRGTDLVVCLDVSRSMLATDVAPNRLERAKADVLDLLAELQGDRVGLVAFAGRPVTACPLTTDQGFFRLALQDANPAMAPRGGSLIGDALRRAMELLPEDHSRDQAIVLITDGEDQDSQPLAAADAAAQRGVKIFSVGLGDPAEGARIPTTTAAGETVYLKNEGQEVWSKLDEDLLQQLALRTGGAYVPAATRAHDLGAVYRERLSQLRRGEEGSAHRERLHEPYQIFAALGLFSLMAYLLLPAGPPAAMLLVFCLPQGAPGAAPPASAPIAASAQSGADAQPAAAADPEQAAAQGLAHYRAGELPEAAEAFRAAAPARPGAPLFAFNRGVAELALANFEDARNALLRAATAPDPGLALDARYDLGLVSAGQARVRLGDQPEALEQDARADVLQDLEDAATRFRECLEADPARADARDNLELVRALRHALPEQWRAADLAKAREGKDVLAYLSYLQDWQEKLRDAARAAQEQPSSPLRNEGLRDQAREQRELAGELAPLADKLAEALAQAGMPQEQVQQALDGMHELAQQAGKALQDAAAALQQGDAGAARPLQKSGAEQLERLYRALAPLEALLQRGIATEKELVAASQAGAPPEPERLVERQANVAAWCQLIALQAQQRLDATAQAPPAQAPQPPQTGAPDAAAQQAMLQKAVELAPQAEQECRAARAALDAEDCAAALPHQQKALELLEEIAKSMPQQDQQDQNQDQDQDQDQNQQQNPDQDQDQGQQDQQQPQDQKDSQQDAGDPKEQQPQPQGLTREDAEKLLQKAREREQQYRAIQAQLEQALAALQQAAALKDW